MLHWAVFLGFAVGELIWKPGENGKLTFTLKPWNPRFVFWNAATRMYQMQTTEGIVDIEPGNGQWVVLAPRGLKRAYMHGVVRYLYIQWLLRQWALRDSGRYSEVYGQPIRVARMPASAPDEDKDRFMNALAGMANETTIRLPAGADGINFEVELIEAKGNGFEGFDRLVNSAGVSISIGLLGQNLTTEVQGGSLAAATVHSNVRSDIITTDCGALGEMINAQVLPFWAKVNYGDEKVAPKVEIDSKPPEDKAAAATTMGLVGDGVTKLSDAGLPVDPKAVKQRFDLPLVEESLEEELSPTEPEPVEPGNEPGEPKPTPPTKKTTASVHTRNAAEPAIEGQLRVDDLVTDAKPKGVMAQAAQLSKLLAAIDAATDFEDLQNKIVLAFGAMEHAQLAALMRQALVLAELEGRGAAQKEATE
jgi:phage gp29-like protein